MQPSWTCLPPCHFLHSPTCTLVYLGHALLPLPCHVQDQLEQFVAELSNAAAIQNKAAFLLSEAASPAVPAAAPAVVTLAANGARGGSSQVADGGGVLRQPSLAPGFVAPRDPRPRPSSDSTRLASPQLPPGFGSATQAPPPSAQAQAAAHAPDAPPAGPPAAAAAAVQLTTSAPQAAPTVEGGEAASEASAGRPPSRDGPSSGGSLFSLMGRLLGCKSSPAVPPNAPALAGTLQSAPIQPAAREQCGRTSPCPLPSAAAAAGAAAAIAAPSAGRCPTPDLDDLEDEEEATEAAEDGRAGAEPCAADAEATAAAVAAAAAAAVVEADRRAIRDLFESSSDEEEEAALQHRGRSPAAGPKRAAAQSDAGMQLHPAKRAKA